MITREPIFSALASKFSSLKPATFKTISRRLKHFNEVSPSEQPALFVTAGDQIATYSKHGPPTWTLIVELYIYARHDGHLDPSPILNPLLDAVEGALAFDDVVNGKLTLGGLVETCRIEGQVQVHEGAVGDQSIMIIPVQILAR